MAEVKISKDFSEVEKPVSGTPFTRRQWLAVILILSLGLPLFYLLRVKFQADLTSSVLPMAIVTVPIGYIVLYKKDGLYIDRHIKFFVDTYFIRNTERPYVTQNLYDLLEKERRFAREVERILFKGKSPEEIQKIREAGEKSTIKIGKKKIIIPIKGPINYKTKKELEKAVKKAKFIGDIPKSAQETIPYEIPHEDGIFESASGYFTQTIAFEDVTYQLLDNEPKEILFGRWHSLINFFDNKVHFQFNYANMEMNREEYAKDFIIPLVETDNALLREVCREYSGMQVKQFSKGTNNLKKVRYLTYGIEAADYPTAKRQLSKITKQLERYFKRLESKYKVLSGYDRLELLFKIFHPGTKDKLLWNFDLPIKTGLSSKDFISPSSFCFKPGKDFNATKYFKFGDRIGAVSRLHIDANDMDDRIVWDMLSINSNVWISIHGDSFTKRESLKQAKNYVSDVQEMIISKQKRAVNDGYDMDYLPAELRATYEDSEDLYRDIKRGDEKMINTTITIVQTAATRKELEDNIFELQNILEGFSCKLIRLDNRQEQGFMSSLPLGNNTIEVKRTFVTKDIASLIPFTTKELYSSKGQYYGMNSLSNNVIMVDKKRLVNPNSLIFGMPGYGKTFFVKREIFDVFLKTSDDILIIDPEGEYEWLVKSLGGQVIKVGLNSPIYINPMEIDLTCNKNDEDYEPIAAKCNFIVSLCEQILGKNGELDKDKIGVIDQACKAIYHRYESNPNPENMPILEDLYQELRNMPDEMKKIGMNLSVSLSRYVTGSLSYFNHRSNVNIKHRLVCFDLKEMDANQRDLTMLIIQEAIWNRVKINRAKGMYTRVNVDEFHLLLKHPNTAAYSVEMWKRLALQG
ncbi:MAG: VirB4-like conjugal transfer ATPase, CD1110 family [Lachnospiraceae bacterium]